MTAKNILVTGASSGIGKATVEMLTERGANVVAVSRDADKLHDVLNGLAGCNLCFPYDLSDLSDIESIFAFCSDNGLKLDGMVHCAGVAPLVLLKENTIEVTMKVFNLNVFSFFELVRIFQLDKYSNEGSSIVGISSITANQSGFRQVLYGSSKGALNSAVKLMARELWLRRIRINSIMPGVANTPMLDELRNKSPDLDEKLLQRQPLGIIEPRSIADLVGYLLSENAKYMTGLNIPIDGGALL